MANSQTEWRGIYRREKVEERGDVGCPDVSSIVPQKTTVINLRIGDSAKGSPGLQRGSQGFLEALSLLTICA